MSPIPDLKLIVGELQTVIGECLGQTVIQGWPDLGRPEVRPPAVGIILMTIPPPPTLGRVGGPRSTLWNVLEFSVGIAGRSEPEILGLVSSFLQTFGTPQGLMIVTDGGTITGHLMCLGGQRTQIIPYPEFTLKLRLTI